MNGKLDLSEPPTSLPALLETIYRQRVTGQVLIVLHCQNGVPQAADAGMPVPVTARCTRLNFRTAKQNGLDKQATASAP